VKTVQEFWRAIEEATSGYQERFLIHSRDAEWRRLVEEAHGERDRAYLTSAEYLAAKNNAVAERDRLKSELAEARRRANDATAMVRDACSAHSDGCRCEWCTFLVAATPAEQAHPTSKDDDQCARCPWPRKHHGPTGKFPCEGFVETAEQAQGKGAKRYVACAGTCGRRVMVYPGEDPVWHCGNAHCQIRTAAPDGHHRSSREASMSTQTENYAEKVSMPVDSDAQRHDNGLIAQVAALAKRVDALFYAVGEMGGNHYLNTAPPPPEAAGPGHAFCCKFASSHPAGCSKACLCDICDEMQWKCTGSPIHAVPPIPGGGAR
jgi:hypothetical protein